VIHQFTSHGHLDQNRVVDTATWHALLGDAGGPDREEESDMRLIPRRALARPPADGRIGYIKFEPSTRTLMAFNGIDFDRSHNPAAWKITDGANVVSAQLQFALRGPLSYAETPDGTAVVITDDSDGGTFALPYRELVH
jgi:hypothetical protein